MKTTYKSFSWKIGSEGSTGSTPSVLPVKEEVVESADETQVDLPVTSSTFNDNLNSSLNSWVAKERFPSFVKVTTH